MIWLEDSEQNRYDEGDRIFKAPTNAVKFRLAERDDKEKLLPRLNRNPRGR